MSDKNLHVLSIQSYVCFGYVGNKAAMFSLQRMGIEVTGVNTVQFSNHTGYEHFAGDVMSSDHLARVLSGLKKQGIFKDFSAVISGYQGSLGLGEQMIKTFREIKQENPLALYCCDPVIGDIGVGQFVKTEVAEFIQQTCLPLADIITPNGFEFAYLSGESLDSLSSVSAIQSACLRLHAQGPKIIVITSLPPAARKSHAFQLCLSVEGKMWILDTPELILPWPPSGSGDAAAAMFVGYLLQFKDPKIALEKMAASMFEVFETTFERGTRELQFIQAQERMMQPRHHFLARPYE